MIDSNALVKEWESSFYFEDFGEFIEAFDVFGRDSLSCSRNHVGQVNNSPLREKKHKCVMYLMNFNGVIRLVD